MSYLYQVLVIMSGFEGIAVFPSGLLGAPSGPGSRLRFSPLAVFTLRALILSAVAGGQSEAQNKIIAHNLSS